MTYRYRAFMVTLVAAFLFVGTAREATAQISMFLELDNIPGDVTSPGYQDQVEVLSYSHGASQAILIGGGGGPVSDPFLSDISFVKLLDPATTPMLKKLTDGLPISTAKFDFVTGAAKTGNAMPMLVMRVELVDAYMTSYSVSYGGGGSITEQWSLAYKIITITYYHPGGGSTSWTYNVETNTELAASVEGVSYVVDGQDVVFTWRTLSESGNYGFEIQHLEEDEFRRAAYVPASGWSSEPLEYDVRIRGLRPGIHMFRLAALGVDGKVGLSQTMRVALGVPDGTTLALDAPFPNPFTTSTNVYVTSDRAREARIAVFDALGREVQVLFDGTLDSGAKTRYTFEAPTHLARGMYMIRVQTDDATRTTPVILGR